MKPTIPDVMQLINKYHSKYGVHAATVLRTVLVGKNIDDDDILDCMERAKEKNDIDGYHLAYMLLNMSRTQRRKLVDMSNSYDY